MKFSVGLFKERVSLGQAVSYWFGVAVVIGLLLLLMFGPVGCTGYKAMVRQLAEQCVPVEIGVKWKQKQVKMSCKETQ